VNRHTPGECTGGWYPHPGAGNRDSGTPVVLVSTGTGCLPSILLESSAWNEAEKSAFSAMAPPRVAWTPLLVLMYRV
jgi:hypothetical protein